MKQYAIATPKGTKDILYNECRTRRAVENRLAEMFAARGYDEIITPTLEYYDVLLESGTITQEEVYKLVDNSGRLLALRPDMTTPIARVAATRLAGADFPQRLYYIQNVFRTGKNLPHGSEFTQAGVELLGAVGVRADTEVIALAIESLSRVSGKYSVEIGHAEFFKALVRSLGTSEAFNEELRTLVEGKNFAALNDLLAPYADLPAYEALRRLPQLFGGEEVLDEALELARGCVGVEEINYLRTIFQELTAAGFGDNIMIDLGLVQHIHYYTGVVFRGYADGIGASVLNGGRYDSLTGLYGKAMPATGFAIGVDELCQCAEKELPVKKNYLIHTERGYLRKAMDYMDRHRPGQCELSPCETADESKALAKTRGIAYVVVIGANGATTMEV